MLAAKGLMKKDIMCKMVNKCKIIEQLQNFKYLPYEEIKKMDCSVTGRDFI
jgi:hypothetical protein